MKTIMSVDLEGDWDSDTTDNIKQAVPRLLDFFENNKIKATFFTIGKIAEQYPKLIKKISKNHEIASHGYEHINLKTLSDTDVENSIKKSKKVIEDLGIECLGFRAPMFVKPNNLFSLLKKYNYVYDSSTAPSFFPGRYLNFRTKPCIKNDILEIPVSSLIPGIPFSLSYIRLFYPCSKVMLPKNPLMFYFHSYEFLEKPAGKEIPPYVRIATKRNRGEKAWIILNKIIKNYKFMTCREYVKTIYPNLL